MREHFRENVYDVIEEGARKEKITSRISDEKTQIKHIRIRLTLAATVRELILKALLHIS